jgi:hypothetical protein
MSDYDPLEELARIAGRSESPESVGELVDAVRARGLPHPGPPIVLVLTVTVDGASSVRYLGEPEQAIRTLREVADNIEAETQ